MLRLVIPVLMMVGGQPKGVVNVSIIAPEPVTHCVAYRPGVRPNRFKPGRAVFKIGNEKYMDMYCKTPDGREINWRAGPYYKL